MNTKRMALFTVCLLCLLAACRSNRSEVTDGPIQVTVQPDRSKGAGIGDLRVTLRNRSTEDLVFNSFDLPWEVNAGGIAFVIHREDGSKVSKTPLIADPIVGMPALLKRGGEISHGMSLRVYYVDLPKELALHDLKVNWNYSPKPTNSVVTSALVGEFLLKRTIASGGSRLKGSVRQLTMDRSEADRLDTAPGLNFTDGHG